MNFFNPYYYTFPTNYVQPQIGILGRIFGRTGVTISSFLNGTQRVLNIANQTIPLVKQIKPMVGNAKTMFKVMNEFKRSETPYTNNNNSTLNNNNTIVSPNVNTNTPSNSYVNTEITNERLNQNEYNSPTFFM